MDAVIIIHGFDGPGDPEVRIKEVAIAGLCSSFFGHWIIEHPSKEIYEREFLPFKESSYDGLCLRDGCVSLEKLKRDIGRISFEDCKIYTADEVYSDFIEKVTGIQPVSLLRYDVPSAWGMRSSYPRVPRCLIHEQKKIIGKSSFCALQVAGGFRKWLRQHCGPAETIVPTYKKEYGEKLYVNLSKKYIKSPPSTPSPPPTPDSTAEATACASTRRATDLTFPPGSYDEVG